MIENVGGFLLSRPCVGIWELVICRFSLVNSKTKQNKTPLKYAVSNHLQGEWKYLKPVKNVKVSAFFCQYLNERGYQEGPINGKNDYFHGYMIQSNNRKVIPNNHKILRKFKIKNIDLDKE